MTDGRKPLKIMLKLKKQLFRQMISSPETYVFDGSDDLTQPFEKPEGFVIPSEGEDFIMMTPKMTVTGHVNRIVNHFEFADEDTPHHTQTIGMTLVTFDDLDKFRKVKR